MTGIAIAAQAVVGAALMVVAIAGMLLWRQLTRQLAWRWGSAALLIGFCLFTGLALISPMVCLLLPDGYRGSGIQQLSWIGAAALAPLAAVSTYLLIRAVLELPSEAEFEGRVAAHRRTVEKLRDIRNDLEERVAARSREVYEAKKRLELALRVTNITVSMMDLDLRYVWIRNAPAGFDAQYMIGRTDDEILPGQASRDTMVLKRKVLDTGEEQRGRIAVDSRGKTRHFDLTVEPYRDEDGSIAGILCVTVEETDHMEREERLRNVLREMSHRSKNTLTILLGIARQTAQRSNDLDGFLTAFDARLRALVGSQDLLVEHDWRAIPLDELLRTQIRPYLNPAEKRLHLDGPSDVRIRAEPAQNLGLALHELARNAHSYGALSDSKGQLRVKWFLDPADDPRTLKIVWQELDGPLVTSPTAPPGFGRTMTERILARALDGRATINYRPEGVVCEIEISMAHVEAWPLRRSGQCAPSQVN